jgi:hypothetical protein
MFTKSALHTKIVVASRDNESEVFEVTAGKGVRKRVEQLTLFEL